MTTIDRPSDEMAGKVVAEQHGLDSTCFTFHTILQKDRYSDPPTWFHYDNKGDKDHRYFKDPRDDLDAAMELLWHLEMKLRPTHSIRKGEGWIAGGEYGDGVQEWIPRSGPGLRYGIVRIAAEVMGVEG